MGRTPGWPRVLSDGWSHRLHDDRYQQPAQAEADRKCTDPSGFAQLTAHPTKPYIYNSDSDQAQRGNIEIWSIKNPAKPEKITDFPVYTRRAHDISFNADGTKAVTAASGPRCTSSTQPTPKPPPLSARPPAPAATSHTMRSSLPMGRTSSLGTRRTVEALTRAPVARSISTSYNGAIPVLKGSFHPGDKVFAHDGQSALASCTSHVFDISDDGSKLAISWYSAGTHYLDISSMTGVTMGDQRAGEGVTELGWFEPTGGVTWSSKFHKGPYIYSNDKFRGFDVFKITG